ncbi:DnaB-like helicase C-terminal domain-containing protein [Spirosoma sp. SC4-14]|uniref:replicative DNA helicase n=1 Tax=Spirosoma sp. SC4-14 TaxID=3128900 RepID=UPI0030D0EC91
MNTELMPNYLINVDEQLEAMLLGSVLNAPHLTGNLLKYIKKPSVFYNPRHQAVYKALSTLYQQGDPIDLVLVNRWLQSNQADNSIDAYYLSDLVNQGHLTGIDRHCLQLFKLAIKRYLGQYGGELRRKAMEPHTDPLELINLLTADVDTILGAISSMQEKSAKDFLKEVFNDLEDKQAGRKRGLTFGVTDLDDRVGGFAPGNYVVLAAGTGMGKTGFMVHVIRHQCLVEQNPIGVVTLEMTGAEYMARLVAAESDYSNSQLNRANVDIDTLYQRTQRLVNMPLHIHDKPLESVELQYIIREWVRRKKVKMVVLDYLQLVKDSRYPARIDRVSNLSMDLKALAGELGIVIVAISQLNRDFEKRKDFDKRPMLSDLKESSQLEQDATAVLFLFRPFKYGLQYEDGSADVHTMELHGLKFRGAQPTDRHEPWLLDYDGACNRVARFGSLKYGRLTPLSELDDVDPQF